MKPDPASSQAGGSDWTDSDDVMEGRVPPTVKPDPASSQAGGSGGVAATTRTTKKEIVADTFNIFVSTGKKTLCLQASWNDTVGTLKAMIQAKEFV